jgi:hypothetical protein
MPDPEVQPLGSYALDLFADYYQFYLRDEKETEDQPDDWGDQLVMQMIAVAPGIIGVGTARNTTVPVSVDVVDSRPDNDFTAWDHVTEASLEVPSGRIVIAGTSDYLPDAKRLAVSPGTYRVRVHYGGLDSISENGLAGEDHYHLVLWPEADRPSAILKRWTSLP